MNPASAVRLTPDPYLGRLPGQYYTVEEIRSGEALVMLQRLPTGALSSWSFILREHGPSTTRLLVRARASRPRPLPARIQRALELLLLEPGRSSPSRSSRLARSAPARAGAPRRAGGVAGSP